MEKSRLPEATAACTARGCGGQTLQEMSCAVKEIRQEPNPAARVFFLHMEGKFSKLEAGLEK